MACLNYSSLTLCLILQESSRNKKCLGTLALWTTLSHTIRLFFFFTCSVFLRKWFLPLSLLGELLSDVTSHKHSLQIDPHVLHQEPSLQDLIGVAEIKHPLLDLFAEWSIVSVNHIAIIDFLRINVYMIWTNSVKAWTVNTVNSTATVNLLAPYHNQTRCGYYHYFGVNQLSCGRILKILLCVELLVILVEHYFCCIPLFLLLYMLLGCTLTMIKAVLLPVGEKGTEHHEAVLQLADGLRGGVSSEQQLSAVVERHECQLVHRPLISYLPQLCLNILLLHRWYTDILGPTYLLIFRVKHIKAHNIIKQSKITHYKFTEQTKNIFLKDWKILVGLIWVVLLFFNQTP